VKQLKNEKMKAKIKLTVSHNEVTPNYSVMSENSTLVVELNEEKATLGKQFPYLLDIWGQQIWDLYYPNTYGKVIETKFIN
jgi:hypothetical protein